jgi:hypothetical protein
LEEIERESMEFDVVIVGAGPAGLAAAIWMSRECRNGAARAPGCASHIPKTESHTIMARTRSQLWVAALPLTAIVAPAAAYAQTGPTQLELLDRIKALEATVTRLEARLSSAPANEVTSRTPPAAQIPPKAPLPAFAPTRPSAKMAKPVEGAVQVASTEGEPTPSKTYKLRIGSHEIQAGGFIKLEAALSQYSAGNLASSSTGRELLLPGTIPVGGRSSREAHIDARQTRFWVGTTGMIGDVEVGSRLEVDLLGGEIDDRTTNGSPIRLRRAYFTVGDFLFGQEWTNFQDNRAFPESGNLIGPAAGTLLVRQAQIRYTRGPLSVSIENPETTYSPFGSATRVTTGDNVMPDMTVRYTKEGKFGFVSLSGLLLQIRSDGPTIRSSSMGWGVSASGKITTVGQDDLRFQVTGGSGISRYFLNFANDGAIDSKGKLHAIPVVAGFAAYRHFWTPTVRSTFTFNAQRVFNQDFVSADSNRLAIGGQVNIVWSPARSVDVGLEHIWLRRELESGVDGVLNRSLLFARLGF